MTWFGRYGKTLAAALMLVVTVVQAALSDAHITQAEWLQICIAATTAVNVYVVPDLTRWPASKTLVTAVLGALEAAVTLVDNGVSSADWSAIILAALTVVAVRSAPAVVHPAAGRSAAGRAATGGAAAVD